MIHTITLRALAPEHRAALKRSLLRKLSLGLSGAGIGGLGYYLVSGGYCGEMGLMGDALVVIFQVIGLFGLLHTSRAGYDGIKLEGDHYVRQHEEASVLAGAHYFLSLICVFLSFAICIIPSDTFSSDWASLPSVAAIILYWVWAWRSLKKMEDAAIEELARIRVAQDVQSTFDLVLKDLSSHADQ